MRKNRLLIVASGILLVGIMVIAYISFNYNVTKHLKQNVSERMNEMAVPNIVSVELQIEEQIKKVKTLAAVLGTTGEIGDAAQIELLNIAVETNGLLRCAIAYPDGSFVTHDSKNDGNVAASEFFLKSMGGEFFIGDPQPAVVDETKTVVLFACPIMKDGKVAASLIYSYLCDDMDKIFNLNFLDGAGQMQIIRKDGELLIGKSTLLPGRGNILEYLRTNCTHEKHSPQDCLVVNGKNGNSTVTLADTNVTWMVSYDLLDYNDWYMLMMIPENSTDAIVLTVAKDQRILGMIIVLCVALYIAILLAIWMFKRNNIDKLTGALTVESFKRTAKKILRNNGEKPYVMVKLDVKNFKLINRIYSFEEGDRVIKNISIALKFALEGRETVFARVGIDDFVFLLPYAGREALDQDRSVFIKKFTELMGNFFTTVVEFPTGQYVLTPEDFPKLDIAEIMEKVNFAHRAAKQKDWGIIVDYEENLEKEALMEKSIADKMTPALSNNEFQLYLQPKYSVQTEEICGAEALVRWEVNGKHVMHPVSFIPVLEKNGFIVKMDMYMFDCTVQKIRSFMDQGITPVTISVNFSRTHLSNSRFVEELCEIVDRYSVPHKYLEIELTESAVFGNVELITQLIDHLHEAGFSISMDDFGSGYSCLALLKDVDMDVIKLDKCFFDPCSEPNRANIVISNIMRMANELNVITVAEGIEDVAQIEQLRLLGCDMIQGYVYSKPIPADQFHLPNPPGVRAQDTKIG